MRETFCLLWWAFNPLAFARSLQLGWIQLAVAAVGAIAANNAAKKAKASQEAAARAAAEEARAKEAAAKEAEAKLEAKKIEAAAVEKAKPKQSPLSLAGLGGDVNPWALAAGALLVVVVLNRSKR